MHGTGGAVIDSTYDEYLVTFSHVLPGTAAALLWMRTTTDATNFDAGASDYSYTSAGASSNGSIGQASAGDTKIILSGSAGVSLTAGADGINGELKFYGPSAAKFFGAQWQLSFLEAFFDSPVTVIGTGFRLAAANVDGIRFMFSTGTLASGTIKLFGRKL